MIIFVFFFPRYSSEGFSRSGFVPFFMRRRGRIGRLRRNSRIFIMVCVFHNPRRGKFPRIYRVDRITPLWTRWEYCLEGSNPRAGICFYDLWGSANLKRQMILLVGRSLINLKWREGIEILNDVVYPTDELSDIGLSGLKQALTQVYLLSLK